MDEEKKNIIQLMLGFVRRANGDHVSAYAAQAAYFLIMSFIPFMLFLTRLDPYTPLTIQYAQRMPSSGLCPEICRILC